MSGGTEAAAFLCQKAPDLEVDLKDYLVGYLKDPTTAHTCAEDDGAELEELVRPALDSEEINEQLIEDILVHLKTLVLGSITRSVHLNGGPAKLDKIVSLSLAPSFSNALLPSSVDITSNNKSRETQVDLKKLEKAEAKIKAKADKKAKRTGLDLYQGSKLLDASRQQKEYEELYKQVNPLQDASAKGKSKDIHLENIDVSFGSLRILNNANLTLAHGRRYGLIGRNGIGKTSLLRQIAMREIPVPSNISILYVEQEVHGGDETALEAVLSADVWREHLLKEEQTINEILISDECTERQKDEASVRLGEVHELLLDIDAASGPARAAELLFGLGFSSEDQCRPTRSFSGGWRMRLSLARALFCKPDLLCLDEPSNNLDLNALAWLEDYMANTWKNTLLVVSHDRTFLDAVATDIVHQHSQRLDYYKGNFTQFYVTRSERAKAQQKEYESQMEYRAHLQAFIDRWCYNANRAAQAQSKIKVLEKLPDLEPPEQENAIKFKFEDPEKLNPPLLQLNEVGFAYSGAKEILKQVNIDVNSASRIGIIGPNGAGKTTLLKLLIKELDPSAGVCYQNGRCRIAYFAQHQVDALDLSVSPVAYLATRFPGRTETEYRAHLGNFGITGTTGLQLLATLSGGQKSRVALAILSLQHPHILILDEPSNHLDLESMDALIHALKVFKGGVLVVSHDTTFIHNVCQHLYVCADGKVYLHKGDVGSYKQLILNNAKTRPV